MGQIPPVKAHEEILPACKPEPLGYNEKKACIPKCGI
jgi:hypothetical protein